MKTKWLIQKYDDDKFIIDLIKEVKSQDMECKVIKCKPWNTIDIDQYKNEDCVVFYGTLNLGRQIQKQKGWVPGAYCNFQNLTCITYFSHWGKYLLNNHYLMMPILEIYRQSNHIYNTFKTSYIFIRPDSGAKTFTGQLINLDNLWPQLDNILDHASMPVDQIIAIISSPKIIEKEWRCVVVNKKVITFSQYLENDEENYKREIDKEALELANKIAQEKWQPDIAYTLDICKSDNEYLLLEVNSFSCSGLYMCDVEPIVKEVSKAAIKEWNDYNEI